jgi:hypothetical protein
MEKVRRKKVITDPELIILLLSLIGSAASLVAITNGLGQIKERKLFAGQQKAQRKFIKSKLLDLFNYFNELLAILYSSAKFYQEGNLNPHLVEFKFGSGTLWIPNELFNQFVKS